MRNAIPWLRASRFASNQFGLRRLLTTSRELLCSTLKCSIQHTSGSALSARMTRWQPMRNHTWKLCGKRSILAFAAFLSRIDKVYHRGLKLQLHNRIIQKCAVNARFHCAKAPRNELENEVQSNQAMISLRHASSGYSSVHACRMNQWSSVYGFLIPG